MFIQEKSWWKFWEKKDVRSELIDRLIYVRGVQAMLGYEDWCSNECDLAAKFTDIKFPKHFSSNEDDSSSKKNTDNDYFKKIKNKFNKAKKVLTFI